MNDSHFRSRPFRNILERFTGNPRKSVFNPHDIDELVDRLNALSHVQVRTGKRNGFQLGDRGAIIEVDATAATAAPAASTQLAFFEITFRNLGDYFIGNPVIEFQWNSQFGYPVALTGQNQKIAKQVRMRKSIDKELIDGAIYTITNPANQGLDPDNNRLATDSQNNTQIEYAYPRYLTFTEVQPLYMIGTAGKPIPPWAQSFILAEQVAHTGVFLNPGQGDQQELVWQEVGPARIWETPNN